MLETVLNFKPEFSKTVHFAENPVSKLLPGPFFLHKKEKTEAKFAPALFNNRPCLNFQY